MSKMLKDKVMLFVNKNEQIPYFRRISKMTEQRRAAPC